MSESSAKRVRPKVFIGSSSEGLEITDSLQVNLDHHCEVKPWSQGVFEPGGSTLPSLVRAAQNADFAILVVSPDDKTLSRGTSKDTARDNVIFELGLFMGVLGTDRTFMVYDRRRPPDLPSDLLGITPATYELHEDGDIEAALGAATAKIRQVIKRLGPRKPQTAPPESATTPAAEFADLNSAMEKLGKFLVEAMWTAPRERGERWWERLEQLGAPPALTDPIKKTIKYEVDVGTSLESLISGPLVGNTFYADGSDEGLATEFSIAAPNGRRVYIDLAPDLFATHHIDTIEVTMTTRVSMLKNDPYFAGQVLVVRDVDPSMMEEINQRISQYPDTLGDVRIVRYTTSGQVGALLDAIQSLFANGPTLLPIDADKQPPYRSDMLDILRKEVGRGPTSRYLHQSDRYVSFGVDVSFDAFFERSDDGKLIMIDIRDGLYQDVDRGISVLRGDLAKLLQSDEFVTNVGGLLVVTQVAPRRAIDAFVQQITEPQSPVPIVLADVSGPGQRDRLIEALRQVSHLPGQSYD